MPATFGGVAIFGTAVRMETGQQPREAQVNAYFGLSGLERLDGGSRGLHTSVTGLLIADEAAGLAAAEALFRSFNDGKARLLVDTLGAVWPNVVYHEFRPHGKVGRTADGRCFRSYQATFFHLTDP